VDNPFALRSAAVGAPLGKRHNSEPITVTFDDDSTLRGRAVVDIDDPQPSLDGVVVVEGRMSVLVSDVARYFTPRGIVQKVLAREENWHVYGRGPNQFGMQVFLIRRTFREADHTNIYDINDNQAVWHQA